ncbi:hypothetical protein DPMN_033739 [Dreissena polymorpha]|uniref:Uncharacterized protein n=1 Tax=Dreissena polymorpha TaxID=45954 RepID=A0A9D4M8W2_DREPO|nr:hypothetical protein DPMN_033739 [Dreissena polymorpha]
MGQDRLCDLALLSIEKEMVENIDIDAIIYNNKTWVPANTASLKDTWKQEEFKVTLSNNIQALAELFDDETNQYLVSLGEIKGTLPVVFEPRTSRSLGGHHIHYATAISDEKLAVGNFSSLKM